MVEPSGFLHGVSDKSKSLKSFFLFPNYDQTVSLGLYTDAGEVYSLYLEVFGEVLSQYRADKKCNFHAPDVVLTAFEDAVIGSVSFALLETTHPCCLFHFA